MIPGAGPTKAHRRGRSSFRALCLPKTRGERERAHRPSRASFEPGGVYAGFAAISSQGSLPPEKKLPPCSFRARKCTAFQRKLRRGGSGGGDTPPPPRNSRPSRVNSFPPACTAETQQFLRRGACPPEKKLLPFRSERPGGRPAARPVSECIFAQVTSSLGRNVVAGGLAPPSKICPSHPQMLHTLYGALW